jgi:hypothetical protein
MNRRKVKVVSVLSLDVFFMRDVMSWLLWRSKCGGGAYFAHTEECLGQGLFFIYLAFRGHQRLLEALIKFTG